MEDEGKEKEMKLTINQQKEFIKDYYGHMPYSQILVKYGLTKYQADKTWDELCQLDTDKHYLKAEGGKDGKNSKKESS